MSDRGYHSSGSSRPSTPSPRSSKSYLEPLSIHRGTILPTPSLPQPQLIIFPEPKQQHHHQQRQQKTPTCPPAYPTTYLSPPRTTAIHPRNPTPQAQSRSQEPYSPHHTSSRKPALKPLSIHQSNPDTYTPRNADIQSDKRQDSRYYTNSFLESGSGSGGRDRDTTKYSYPSRKGADARYYPNSSY